MKREPCAHRMRLVFVSLAAVAFFGPVLGAQQAARFEMDFTNDKLIPPHWELKLNSDGSGQFDAAAAAPSPEDQKQIQVGELHRPIQLSAAFTDRVFETAHQRRLFDFPCESHMKVAMQGIKRLSYSGPEGNGACEFNYSKDKQIQALSDSFLAVENTLIFGARLEKLMQHDRLGVDQEMENLVAAVHEGNAIELGAIRSTLDRIASDEEVLERARRKARLLLTSSR
jgi:hypothetical protein